MPDLLTFDGKVKSKLNNPDLMTINTFRGVIAIAWLCLAAVAWAQPRAGLNLLSGSFGGSRFSSQFGSPTSINEESDRPSLDIGVGYTRFYSERWAWSAGLGYSFSNESRDINIGQPFASSSTFKNSGYSLNAGLNRFFKLSDQWFVSTGGNLAFSTNTSSSLSTSPSTPASPPSESNRYTLSANFSASLWYFVNKRWAFRAGLDLLNVGYGWGSGSQESSLGTLSTTEFSRWDYSFTPTNGLSDWFIGISYQF